MASVPPINANNVVLVTMVGTAIVVIGSDLQSGGIKGTHLIALGLVYAALAAINDFAPKLAIPFSVLVLTGVLLTRGPKIINAFGNIGKSDATLTDVASGKSNVQQSPSAHNPVVSVPRRVRTAPGVITLTYGGNP